MTKNTGFALQSAEFTWRDDVVFTPPLRISQQGQRASVAATRASDLGPLLDDFLETIVENVNACAGVIRIHPLNSPTLQTISSYGLPSELVNVEHLVEFECEVRGKMAIEQEIYSSDLSICTARANCHHPDCLFKSAISLPIESHAPLANPIGIITLFFDTSHSHRASKTVQAFAKILSSSIEHIRSTRESKRADRMAARQAIANEIHDSLAQTLVYTRMRTSLLSESIRKGDEVMAARYAQDIDEGLEYSQKTVRELIRDFRCEMDPAGLLQALQKLAEQFEERHDISLVYINQVADLELPLEYEIEVFNIVREALTNIAKHSDATHARLLVDFVSGYYVFTIEDNGIGGAAFAPVEGHYGMMIMRERAHRIGGEIKVGSAAGLGTQVQLFFPEPSLDWRINYE